MTPVLIRLFQESFSGLLSVVSATCTCRLLLLFVLEPPAGADQGGEGEGTGDFHASFTDEHGEHEEEGEVDEATPSTAGGEEVVASDQQGEHEGEGDEPSTGKADDNGIADLLKLMTKDMHIDFAKKQFGQLSSVVKELTDHLHKAHGEGKKQFLHSGSHAVFHLSTPQRGEDWKNAANRKRPPDQERRLRECLFILCQRETLCLYPPFSS